MQINTKEKNRSKKAIYMAKKPEYEDKDSGDFEEG